MLVLLANNPTLVCRWGFCVSVVEKICKETGSKELGQKMISLCVAPSGNTIQERLQAAVDVYVTKYGIKPQSLSINPQMLPVGFEAKAFHGVIIIPDEKLKLGDIWLKVE